MTSIPQAPEWGTLAPGLSSPRLGNSRRPGAPYQRRQDSSIPGLTHSRDAA